MPKPTATAPPIETRLFDISEYGNFADCAQEPIAKAPKKKTAEELAAEKAEIALRRNSCQGIKPATEGFPENVAAKARQKLSKEASAAIAAGKPYPIEPMTVQFCGGGTIAFSQDGLANLFTHKGRIYRWVGKDQNPVEVRHWLRVNDRMTAEHWIELFYQDLSLI